MCIRDSDYTVARVRLGLFDVAVGALLVAWFTVGGGLQSVFDGWSGLLEPGSYAHSLAFIGTVSVIGFLAGLPFVLWRTFVIEERFGFNKMTVGLFIADLLKDCLLYTSDAADERSSVDLGGRRIIKKKKKSRQASSRRQKQTKTNTQRTGNEERHN